MKVGVATVDSGGGAVVIVYAALDTALLVMPVARARALMVVVLVTLMGPVYEADDAIGVEPSVVTRMVAPAVLQAIVTDCAAL